MKCSGTVWCVGSKVESVKPGDRVAVWPVKSCKECFACKEGYGHVCQSLKVRGIETEGAFQYAWTLDEEALVKIPDTVSMLHGALAEPLAICCHVVKRGNVKKGDFVVVIGGGPIGIMTALAAKAAGADVVFETSGSQPGVDSMVQLPRVHGAVVLVAIYGKPMTVDLKQLYYY
ncbi:hypothetical protein E5329_19210 [Petralouisia muris]|uniref:Uncharacterized protein n=1 Tax=Petralouisia muris TaxID=3032872 RepID=A0AC61RRW9_9FIRM|nr:hypothetical protein E5329_19210 [Petralouisia muris]